MALRDKSLTELRGIAQSFGVKDIFQQEKPQLVQAIELKQQALTPEPRINIPLPSYDPRIMTKHPAKKSEEALLREYLQPYIERGLNFTCDDETWRMSHGIRNDQGTMRMPPRVVLDCARRIMAR